MEAHGPFFLLIRALFVLLIAAGTSEAAIYKTPNFVVNAPTPQFAKQVGTAAEKFRKELAVMWIGKELPNWSAPCPVRVKVGQIGAGGATTFSFHNGEVFGWNMSIQGSEERILDSVLPHEITHTILACRFRRPLPRWADEGLCTLVEHESERRRQTLLLGDVMRSGRRIPLRSLFSMTEYPSDMRDVMKLYAQGYSLVDYLVQQGGRETFMQFLHDALRHGGWDQALSAHYGVNSREKLEKKWGNWVVAGSPRLNLPKGEMLALNEPAKQKSNPASADGTVFRSQTPEATPGAAPDQQKSQQLAGTHSQWENSSAVQDAVPFRPASQVASVSLEQNQSEGQEDVLNHQTSRSRNHLTQPVFRPASVKSQTSEKKQRNQLLLTREGFRSPKTPLSKQDRVHPFLGSIKTDPFTP